MYHFHPEHPSPELVGRDNSLGWQEQLPRHLLVTTVPPGSPARACRRESWAARSSSLAGDVCAKLCCPPSSAEGKGNRIESLKLPFAELGEKVTGEMWLCGISDLLQS